MEQTEERCGTTCPQTRIKITFFSVHRLNTYSGLRYEIKQPYYRIIGNKNEASSMDAPEQENQRIMEDCQDAKESLQEDQGIDQHVNKEENEAAEEIGAQEREKNRRRRTRNLTMGRDSFVHGLAAGLGIGCMAAFVMMWIAVFFTPRLTSGITYEAMLAMFIYPLIYLFALGLVALTVGVVSEYHVMKNRVQG
jgi:hypothetical protein